MKGQDITRAWGTLQRQLLEECQARHDEGLFCSGARNAIKINSSSTNAFLCIRRTEIKKDPEYFIFTVYRIGTESGPEEIELSLDFDRTRELFIENGTHITAADASRRILQLLQGNKWRI